MKKLTAKTQKPKLEAPMEADILWPGCSALGAMILKAEVASPLTAWSSPFMLTSSSFILASVKVTILKVAPSV